MHHTARHLFLAALALALPAATSAQVGTAFTYQGQLNAAGGAVSRCDVRFRLYAAETGGSPIGPQLCFDDLIVTHGAFSAQLDFGDQFTGSPRFIEIDLRPNSALDCSNTTGFTTLTARQPIAPTPHAMFATATRGIAVDAGGKVGVGPGAPTPQFSVDIRALTPQGTAAGGATYIAAGLGGGGAGSGSLLLGGGGAYNVTSGSPGGGVTLAAGNGVAGFASSSNAAGGTVQILGGPGAAASGVANFPGAGGDIVLRPGAGGSALLGLPAPSGVALVNGQLVVDADNAASSILIGGRGNTNGQTILKLATSAGSAGECSIQGVSAFGTDYGTLVLNPQGGVVAKPGGGAFSVYCDQRLKHDLVPMSGTLERLLSLRGYSYQYTDSAVAQRHALPGVQIGLLAQDVQRVFPDWINTDADGFLMVTERATTALMVESLRDLRTEKDAQLAQRDARLQALERENADLKSRLERLERALAK